MKTLLIISILLMSMFFQALPYASAHGVCGGFQPRYVYLEHTTLSKHTLATGENFTITGNMTALTGNDLKGELFLQTKPGPHGRLAISSVEPSGIFDIPGNSTIPYSITVTALIPGNYFVSPGLDLIGIGSSLLNNGCTNTIVPNLTVTGTPICIQGLVAVSKAEDGSPACVKPEDVNKLVGRGWAMNPKSTVMQVALDQSNYPSYSLDYYFLKGMLYTASGPIQNSSVAVFGNNIPIGNATTDKTGCFQFNSWNNTGINHEISNANNNHQESYTLKITTAYLGDEIHNPVNDTKSAVVYFTLFPVPPPYYVSSTNPAVIQVKQGESASLKLSVKYLTGSPVGPMDMTVQRLPCGVTYTIPTSNDTSGNGTFNISIQTQDYTRIGKYSLDVIQDTSHFENPNIIPDPYIGMINLEVLPK
jgi:hypothetical protein